MNLIDKAKTETLAAGGKFRLEDIPLRKFYEQAQYIEKTLLPAIEKKSGNKSADYQFFSEVYKSLLYAVMIVDRDRNIIMKWQHASQLNSFLQQRVDLAVFRLEGGVGGLGAPAGGARYVGLLGVAVSRRHLANALEEVYVDLPLGDLANGQAFCSSASFSRVRASRSAMSRRKPSRSGWMDRLRLSSEKFS